MPTSTGTHGSIPRRYQSVITDGTQLTSFGIRNDDNQRRSHSVGKSISSFAITELKVRFLLFFTAP